MLKTKLIRKSRYKPNKILTNLIFKATNNEQLFGIIHWQQERIRLYVLDTVGGEVNNKLIFTE